MVDDLLYIAYYEPLEFSENLMLFPMQHLKVCSLKAELVWAVYVQKHTLDGSIHFQTLWPQDPALTDSH